MDASHIDGAIAHMRDNNFCTLANTLATMWPRICAGETPWEDKGEAPQRRAIWWSLNELRLGVCDDAPSSHTSPRIREYLAPCFRRINGVETALKLRAGNWCAASACCAVYLLGSAPHPYRASGIELEEDAKSCRYDVRWAEKAPGQRVLVKSGDLAIFQRGIPGDAGTRWMRHVARVMGVRNRAFYTIGGNEGGKWSVTYHCDDPSLLGFIVHTNRTVNLAKWNDEEHEDD